MRRIFQVPSLLVAVLLQLAPLSRTLPVSVLPVASPFAVVWQILLRAAAVAGSFHAVSGATTLVSPESASGKVGVPFNYKAEIFSDQYLSPKSYSATGITPTPKDIATLGFVIDNLSGQISGTPNKAGTHKVKLTGWHKSNLSGDSASYNITFVISPGGTAPTISLQPLAQTATVGDTVTLRVAATGDSPFTYRWIRNGIELSGKTNSTLTFSPVALTDDADYSVRVTNPSGNTPSATVHLTVVAPPVSPVIRLQPLGVSANSGANVEFRSQASGAPAPTYQWFKGSTLLAGKVSSTLFLPNVTTNDEGAYSVHVSNAGGTVPSNPALLTVFFAPSVTLHPSDQTVPAGTSVTFNVAATGKPAPSFQWYHGNTLLIDSTNAILEVTASDSTMGSYHAVASNVAGTALSTSASLTLEPTVVLTVPPLHLISVGETVSVLEFTASPGGAYVIEYLDTLHGTRWAPGPTLSNSTGSVFVEVPSGEVGARFWRVRLGTN